MLLQLILLSILVALSAFFSSSETALMSVSYVKVNALVQQRKKGARALHRVKQNPHRLLVTILIGNTLANIGSGAIAAMAFTALFGSSGVGIATGIMTFFVLTFGEIVPKSFAVQNAERMSLKIARPLEIITYLIYPIVRFFEGIAKLVLDLLGVEEEDKISEEEIRTIVTMGAKEGVLNKEAAHMIHKVLKFQELRVSSILREDMKLVDGDAKLKAVLSFLIKEKHSKYPVYRGSRGNISKILVIDDVLSYVKNNRLNVKVDTVARPAYFVSPSQSVEELLLDFQHRKLHMAIVKDKKVEGLVTLEDVLEEIVGEIFEKSKRPHVYIKKVSARLIRADARASVEEINKELHIGLRSTHFVTLAGFIEHKLSKKPEKGDKLHLKNVTIEVDKVSDGHIVKVRIRRK